MTIENEDLFRASLWNWGPLNECFRNGVRVADVDGEVEIGGYFLRLEGKSPSAPIKRGPQRHWDALRNTGLWTIVVLRGHPQLCDDRGTPGRIVSWSVWPSGASGTDWDSLKAFVKAWRLWAEEQGAIGRRAI